MKLRIFILIFLILVSFNFVSSKAVCGEVLSSEKMTPSWFEVQIFSIENESFSRNCFVSPEEYKYCCSIENSGWKIGDSFEAKITDNSSGYVAKPVYLELTNSPYDVFPVLNLEKVVTFNKPSVNFNISFSNLTPIEIEFLEGSKDFFFNGKNISLKNNSYEEVLELEFGGNNFDSSSIYEDQLFVESKDYFLLKEVNFSRTIVCDGCKNNKIRRGEKVEVFLNYNFSDNISELNIYEYIPYDFSLFESGVDSSYGGGNFQKLSWKVKGDSVSVNYSFLSPDDSDKSVLFTNFLEEIEIESKDYTLYKLIPPISSGSSGRTSHYAPSVFSKVSDIYPLISENDSLILAAYSENFSNEGSLDVFKINFTDKIYNRSLELIEAYEFYTNLGNNFNRLSFELELNGSLLNSQDYNNFLIYGRNKEGNFVSLTGQVVGEGENMKFLIDSDEFFKEVLVFGVKNKLTLWDRIVEFYWNLFGFKTGVI